MAVSREGDRALLGLPSKAEKPDPQSVYVRRVSWIISRGEIPDGQFIIDTCGRKLCINPWHLMLTDHPPTREEDYHAEDDSQPQKQSVQMMHPKMLEQIIKARRQGMSLRKIAEKFQLSPGAVRWHLRKISREQ